MAFITGTSDAVAIANSNLSFIDDMMADAESALGRLESLSMGFANFYYNSQNGSKIDTDIPPLDRVDISSIPTVAEIMGTIQDIQVGPLPQAPAADEIVKYKKHIWEGPQLDAIQSLLTTYMSSMGMPSTALQDAIFDESRERKQRIRADKADLVLATTSARGFKYANMQTAAALKEITDQLGDDLENIDREITKLMTEWARQNFQFAIQQGIAVEQAHMDFSYKYSSIFREIYTTQINATLDIYKTRISMELTKLDANIKAVMARAEAYKLNADLSATEIKLKLDKDNLEYQEAMELYKVAIGSHHTEIGLQIDAAKQRAETVQAIMKSVTSSALGVTIHKNATGG